MTTKNRIPSDSISLAEIEALTIQARAYRAKVMREMLGKLLGQVAVLFKGLPARLRPSRQHQSQASNWV